jgi:Phosphorylated CTD interacting factor 1 WW domain
MEYLKPPKDLSLKEHIYYSQILRFKRMFFQISPIESEYETNKIWSRWIIAQLIETPPPPHTYKIMMPQAPLAFKQLYQEVCDQTNPKAAKYFTTYLTNYKPRPNLTTRLMTNSQITHDDMAVPPLSKIPQLPLLEVPTQIIQNLKHRALRRHQIPQQLEVEIWRTIFNYTFLDGLSLQWSLPDIIFQELSQIFLNRLSGELFASPLHTYLSTYYSLFNTDRFFGSQGDIFQNTTPLPPGIYECNPPFIESIFIKISAFLLKNLAYASQFPDYHLTFIFIMPGWLDSQAYIAFRDSPFKRYEIILSKRQHTYLEPQTLRTVQASFNTHIIILSTQPKPFTTKDRDRLTSIWVAQEG